MIQLCNQLCDLFLLVGWAQKEESLSRGGDCTNRPRVEVKYVSSIPSMFFTFESMLQDADLAYFV
jgi:hypothetical protein